MRFLLLLICLTNAVYAVEVAILDTSSKLTELQFTLTDDALFQVLDKQYMAHPCRVRSTQNGANPIIRENTVARSCRGEIVKFLLNAGYKPIDQKGTYAK